MVVKFSIYLNRHVFVMIPLNSPILLERSSVSQPYLMHDQITLQTLKYSITMEKNTRLSAVIDI